MTNNAECKIDGCKNNVRAKQLCNKHYIQVRLHGQTFVSRKELNKLESETFYSNCQAVTESGCWIWMNYLDSDGYGNFTYKGKPQKAHRWSYLLNFGSIPDGMSVCHTCDVRCCVNPDHLFVGTCADNLRDMRRKGRGPRGEKSGQSKLKDLEVIDIKRRLHLGEKVVRVAELYQVDACTISHIKVGRTWGHV